MFLVSGRLKWLLQLPRSPATENSCRRRKFYCRRKSAAKYCGWSQSAVNLLFSGRQIFLAKFGSGSVQHFNFCKAIVTKPDTRDYVMDTFHQEKCGHWARSVKFMGFLLPSPHIGEIYTPIFAITLRYACLLLFLVLPIAYSQDACTERLIRQTTWFYARMILLIVKFYI